MRSKAAPTKKAKLYRMVMNKHICPYGLKALDLLKSSGYEVEDHHLTSRAKTDAFKKKHGIGTTPQIFINKRRIGGYDDLKTYLRGKKSQKKTSYKPIVNIFALTLLMALSTSWMVLGALKFAKVFVYFVAYSICTLAALKLKDTETFSTTFLSYDLLAQRWVTYSYIYPYAEALAGIGMLSMTIFAAPIAIFIGAVGALSVFKAVYIDKRELQCACIGGESTVPLGFISLTENLMMLGMGIWMLVVK